MWRICIIKNKTIVVILILIFIAIIIIAINKLYNKKDSKESTPKPTIETITSDNGFKTYSLNNINITNPNANLIFLDNLDGTGQNELSVSIGSTYSFEKYGDHTIKVLELNNDYITISINGLAPTKESGGFSLIEHYNTVTIKKNTGICLNVQATDLSNGSVYFFYVNK